MKDIRSEVLSKENDVKRWICHDIWQNIYTDERLKIKHEIGQKIWNNIDANILQRIHGAMMEKFWHAGAIDVRTSILEHNHNQYNMTEKFSPELASKIYKIYIDVRTSILEHNHKWFYVNSLNYLQQNILEKINDKVASFPSQIREEIKKSLKQ